MLPTDTAALARGDPLPPAPHDPGQWVRDERIACVAQRVRSQVRRICCSQCGGPIDLEHSSECPYCHAPVSFLDPGAVEKAVQMWSEAESRRRVGPTPEALADALLRMQLPQQQSAYPHRRECSLAVTCWSTWKGPIVPRHRHRICSTSSDSTPRYTGVTYRLRQGKDPLTRD
jgi:hypothetical protein